MGYESWDKISYLAPLGVELIDSHPMPYSQTMCPGRESVYAKDIRTWRKREHSLEASLPLE